ncbi:hypothetical protein [Streptomyces inhibens]|uniref:hypothetical protein n=1 Tax=Streptomyces inhibens TaxID=2293571 RepID=UPI001EE6A38C|nr:hypothetical protein [Streptomyces inhibens]UKY47802.1 hypothetical protein KI385_02435 [Streptomyces inhibens]
MQIEDPVSLRAAGTGALEMAGELHAKGNHGSEATSCAVAWFLDPFWFGELGGALLDVSERWEEQTKVLVGLCRDVHANCTETANNYTKAESANTETMKSVAPLHTPFG